MIKRVLIALDDSAPAERALGLACEIARRFDAELVAVHVISDKAVSQAERKMTEVEFQAEITGDFDVTARLEARGDARLQSQRLPEQAAETQGRRRWAVGNAS